MYANYLIFTSVLNYNMERFRCVWDRLQIATAESGVHALRLSAFAHCATVGCRGE